MTRIATALVTLLAAALLLGACSGQDQQGSASHRLSVWASGTGLGESIGTLQADNARVPKDVPNGTGAVHAACGVLLDDAEMANGELPSPDTQITAWLTQAYSLEGTAGNDCYNAGATNPTLLRTAERDMVRAEALYTQVLLRIQAVVGHSISTTTTTNNAPGSIFG